jgi:drug/metabolite transporter (DMT)-like permease
MLNWQKPTTWMLAGVVIVIIGAAIGTLGDDEATNPVIAVGVLFVLIGAFTWAIRRGLTSSERKRTP